MLPSLEFSCNDHKNQRETKYFENISWHGPGCAASVEKNPRDVLDRLFGIPDPRVSSVLDTVRADVDRLGRVVGHADRQKIDEFLESIRELESKIQRAEQHALESTPIEFERPAGIPQDRGAYIRTMLDLICLAFQQDLTRAATLVIDPERWDTPRMYHGVFDQPQNHHVLTHTKGEEAREKLKKIDRFHVEQFAYLISRLSESRVGAGCLLDHSLITLGSGIGDGRIHDYNDLPVVTAGSLGRRFPTGSHHVYERKVPLANLWVSMLDAVGSEEESFADSTGRLSLS